MAFSNIIGQNRVKQILKRAFEQHRVPHGYLFHGNEGVGKEFMAIEQAKALLCTELEGDSCDRCANCLRINKFSHPDLIYIFPAPTSVKPEEEQQVFQSLVENPYRRIQLWANPIISIERIRALKRKTALKSFEGKGRVVIIIEAEKMTQAAANSLLKILEEPPEKMNLILVTSHLNQLLDTIISRCQPVRFAPLPEDEIQKMLIQRENTTPEKAQIAARIAFGNYRRACDLLEEDLPAQREFSVEILRSILKPNYERILLVESLVKSKDKLQIKELLILLLLWFRDALIYTQFSSSDETSRVEISKKLVNIDKIEILEKFVKAFHQINYEKIIFELEKAINLINRNVNVTLILIVLFDNLNKFMSRTQNG